MSARIIVKYNQDRSLAGRTRQLRIACELARQTACVAGQSNYCDPEKADLRRRQILSILEMLTSACLVAEQLES